MILNSIIKTRQERIGFFPSFSRSLSISNSLDLTFSCYIDVLFHIANGLGALSYYDQIIKILFFRWRRYKSKKLLHHQVLICSTSR